MTQEMAGTLRFARPTNGESRTLRRAKPIRQRQTCKSNGRDAMRITRFCVALLGFIAAVVPAQAQDKYPNRPVHFIVSFAVGGANDIIARVLCDWLSDHFGQQFVVENRSGASGNVGAQSVINSAPDGYTVMFVGPNN